MKDFQLFIFFSIIFFINSLDQVNEFEEIEIENKTQVLIFNNYYSEELDYYPDIIIICMNPNFDDNIDSKLVISKKRKNLIFYQKLNL